jgi:cation:H+ antiporter
MPVWRPAPGEPRPRQAARAVRTPGGFATDATTTLSGLSDWQLKLALMAACTVPGLLIRLGGAHVPPLLGMVAFGGGVMAAAFMLAAAAEAAEIDVPPGIAVAGVAFVAVLPEFVIEVYFAFSGHVEYVTASLTGSTRLLLSFAVGMPALASFVLTRRGKPRLESVEIDPRRRIDLAVVAAASLYAPVIVLRGHLAWQDSLVLIGLYVAYMRRVSSGDPEPPHLVGMAAELGNLPEQQRRRWVLGIMAFSAVSVLVNAEPFANSVLMSGTAAGVSPYLLVQWLVPLATEMPELVIAFVLITHERAGQAVAVLLSSAVSQWTFALGTLPLAYKAGVGQGPLPLLGREQVELLLTMGQGLLAVSMLVTLRLRQRDAALMLVLFAAQLAIPSVALRAAITVGYLVLAVDVFSSERWAIPTLARALRGRREGASP